MTLELPKLPYAIDALEPFISAETLAVHHGKHHATYVATLNKLVDEANLAKQSLEDLIRTQEGPIFNNAGQAWNHALYWQCMGTKPRAPSREFERALTNAFGSVDAFRDRFTRAALGRFGSGWAWLVLTESGALGVETTHNADTPLRHRRVPVLVCDVWEHAYYLDYKNERDRYVQGWWKVVNWEFAERTWREARAAL